MNPNTTNKTLRQLCEQLKLSPVVVMKRLQHLKQITTQS